MGRQGGEARGDCYSAGLKGLTLANILSPAEAANAIRSSPDDPAMLDLLSSVDDYIKIATGRDWASDSVIHPAAKSAARILLATWYDNPSMQQASMAPFPASLTYALTQLEALALQYKIFAGRHGAGQIALPGVNVGDRVESVVGLIGASGDQSALFEAVISSVGEIQQVAPGDYSAMYFRALLVRP